MSLNIITLSGSLRKASTNTGLIRASMELAPKTLSFKFVEIHEFPMFNEELQHPNRPQVVSDHCQAIMKADGVLFGTPCYNFNISSPLKNYIDWISRGKSPLYRKPVGYIHSGFQLSTKVDEALKRSVGFVQSKIFEGKNFKVKASPDNFDAQGNLTSETARTQLKQYLVGFEQFVRESKQQEKTA